MTTASILRSVIDGHLANYESSAGIGPDAYHSQYSSHPMGDGKHLQVLAVMHDTKLLSISQLQKRTTQTLDRLRRSAITDTVGGWTWGLGFPWRDLPATESFLITSSLVTRGALDCYKAGLATSALQTTLCSGLLGLHHWTEELSIPIPGSNIRIAAYSPGICEPIYNSAAYAYSVLISAALAGCADVERPAWKSHLDWIQSQRHSGLGWTYSSTNPVVDLLHQCYILNAVADVLGVTAIESSAIEMIGQFAGPCCYFDAIRLVIDIDEPWSSNEIPWLRHIGAEQIRA